MGNKPTVPAARETPSYRYVDTAEALEQLCAQLADAEWVAVDTEFVRERTYYPRLCLIQLSTPELNACVDALRLKRLDPVLDILFDPAVIKVMHACRQDMEVFFHLCERLPAPVFDTQVAAPVLGLPHQVGYAALVAELLGVQLDKAHTRTDWCQRPLSEGQLTYAIEDVLYLGPLYLRLRDELQRLERLEWLKEDFAALTDSSLYRNPPGDAWKRIRGAARLKGPQRAVLKALAAWRERTARRADLPRSWLLRDDALLDIARARPRELAQLDRLRSLKKATLEHYGEELLDLVRESAHETPPRLDARARSLSLEQEALLDVMMSLVHVKGAEYGIDPAVIASRNDLVKVLDADRNAAVMHGWRHKVVGRDLIALLDGHLSLHADNGVLRLVPDD